MSAGGLPPALTGLLEPAASAHRPPSVELRETHISWVLLTGKLAFKLKKPLRPVPRLRNAGPAPRVLPQGGAVELALGA